LDYKNARIFAEKEEYVQVLLSIARGNLYSSKIGLDLGKAQSTVAEQLQELEKCGMIFKEKRTKAQEYQISSQLYQFQIKYLQELLASNRVTIKLGRIREIFPEDLCMGLLFDYAKILPKGRASEVSRLPKKKLIEIVVSFLQAILARSLEPGLSRREQYIYSENRNLIEFARLVSIAANRLEFETVRDKFDGWRS